MRDTASKNESWLNKIAVEKKEIAQVIIHVCLFKGNSCLGHGMSLKAA